jgi:hypothetical protein
MPDISADNAIRSVVARIDAAWREKKFDGLEECFDDGAVIVGPNHAEHAVGGKACEESYGERARVLPAPPPTALHSPYCLSKTNVSS